MISKTTFIINFINLTFTCILILFYFVLFVQLDGSDTETLPPEFNSLIGRKFGFKIDIKPFNIRNEDSQFFGISKITDDVDIIARLENNLKVFQVI